MPPKSNGTVYASVVKSIRTGKTVKQIHIANLGRVVDKDKGVFFNHERGLFRYTLEDGYSPVQDTEIKCVQKMPEKEQLILDFGDVFIIDQYTQSSLKFNFRFNLHLQEKTPKQPRFSANSP